MVYRRLLSEVISIIESVKLACGDPGGELEEAIAELRLSYRTGTPPPPGMEELLYDTAALLRELGCLDWYKLYEAAQMLETIR